MINENYAKPCIYFAQVRQEQTSWSLNNPSFWAGTVYFHLKTPLRCKQCKVNQAWAVLIEGLMHWFVGLWI